MSGLYKTPWFASAIQGFMRTVILVSLISLTALAPLILGACAHRPQEVKPMSAPTVTKATPVLFAERIEPSLAFWEKLGFERSNEVPAGDHLGFAILTSGRVELMYQTLDSLGQDMPAVREAAAASRASIFVEVPNLAVVRQALTDAPLFLEERKTFYGSTEIGYREPAGHFVTFAQFGPGQR